MIYTNMQVIFKNFVHILRSWPWREGLRIELTGIMSRDTTDFEVMFYGITQNFY
jgi:hypothetical protein